MKRELDDEPTFQKTRKSSKPRKSYHEVQSQKKRKPIRGKNGPVDL